MVCDNRCILCDRKPMWVCFSSYSYNTQHLPASYKPVTTTARAGSCMPQALTQWQEKLEYDWVGLYMGLIHCMHSETLQKLPPGGQTVICIPRTWEYMESKQRVVGMLTSIFQWESELPLWEPPQIICLNSAICSCMVYCTITMLLRSIVPCILLNLDTPDHPLTSHPASMSYPIMLHGHNWSWNLLQPAF